MMSSGTSKLPKIEKNKAIFMQNYHLEVLKKEEGEMKERYSG